MPSLFSKPSSFSIEGALRGGPASGARIQFGRGTFKGMNSPSDLLLKPFGLNLGEPEGVPRTPTLNDDPVRAAAEEERRRALRAGRASTILTGPQGLTEAPTLTSRALFGAG